MAAEKESKVETPFSVTMEVKEIDERVTLCFNKPITWIGLDPVEALKMADMMKVAAVRILRSENVRDSTLGS